MILVLYNIPNQFNGDKMKKTIILSLALCSVLFGGDVVVKTAGSTASENGFVVKDYDANELFKVQGDGAVQATKGRIQDKSGFVMPVGSLTAFAGSSAPTGWIVCDGSAVSRATYADLFAVIGITYGTGDGSTTFNLPNLGGRNIIGKGATPATDTLGETGGAETHTLTTAQLASHTHSVDPASFNASAASAGSHSHTVDPASFDATAASAGSHSHTSDDVYHYDGGGTDLGVGNTAGSGDDSTGNAWKTSSRTTSSTGAHTHTVAVNVPSTTSSEHTGHTHTVAVDVPNTTSTTAGSGSAHNILDPYIVLNYIIKY
jgi:microcystin-dependent protein